MSVIGGGGTVTVSAVPVTAAGAVTASATGGKARCTALGVWLPRLAHEARRPEQSDNAPDRVPAVTPPARHWGMHTPKRLRVHELSLDVVRGLAPLLSGISARDRNLADQLRRAASSMVLNLAEAAYSDPGNRRARLFTAMGSANETRAALELAAAWRYVDATHTEPALEQLDRVVASLFRWLHPR